ncbi:hypothetical protein VVYB158_13020 [Vibrio vulnificus CladeA-yb158]|uniref:hypothetical protein n=1 Tax=Vibrio vulnificus TaxID=672 RepID=UPI00063D8C87|nr:hypothetical protein [Vibrio vulnificus]KLI66517.1 hypothetical protein VVYB158_13020 [Vibrio vulnificus CladeA-yb158]
MSFGIMSQNNLQGFYLSELPCEVVFASGTATVTDEVIHGFGHWNQYQKATFLLAKVSLRKHLPTELIMSFNDPRNPSHNDEEGLLAPEYSFVAGTDSGKAWGTIGGRRFTDYVNTPTGGKRYPIWKENDESLEMYMVISMATESTWRSSVGAATETIYVMVTGRLPEKNKQEIPESGILMHNSSSEITFNSNYMPLNPAKFLTYPDVPSNYKGTPPFKPSGLSGTLLHPVISIGHGVDINGWNANIGIVFSDDGQRYGARVNGISGSFPYTKAYPLLVQGHSSKFPVYRASDYF